MCLCVCSSFSLCGRVCVGVIAYMLIYVQKLCHTSPSNRDRLHHVGPLEDHLCISNVWTHLWRMAVPWVHVVLLMFWASTAGLLHFKTRLLWHIKLLDLLKGWAGLPGPGKKLSRPKSSQKPAQLQLEGPVCMISLSAKMRYISMCEMIA